MNARPEVKIVSGGADAVRDAAAQSDVRVLALVTEADRRTVTTLLAAGAAGIAMESAPPGELDAAVRAVAAGYVVVPASAGEALRRPMLTSRQQQILSLVVLGLRNAEIATRLHVTESTVKTHLRAVYAELGVRSRKQAVDLVMDPERGLEAGVLGISSRPRRRTGYSTPIVKR